MQTLLKTNQELRQFTTASTGLDIATLNPFLRNSPAEQEIIRVLGRDLYNTLLTAYNSATPLEANLEALLPYVQKPLANLALHAYMQQSGVIISSSGITLTTDRDKQAFQWQHNKIEQAIINTAYFALDGLIAYLFANKQTFPDWETSSEYRQSRSNFINTPGEFQKWVNIRRNYRTLIAIKASMAQIENTLLKPVLGDDYYQELKTEILAIGDPNPSQVQFFIDENGNLILEGDFSGGAFNINQAGQLYVTFYNLQPNNAKVLTDFIQPAVAHLTIARAIHELNFNITADGAFIHTVLGNSTNNINQADAPDQAQKQAFANLHQTEGEAWLKRLSTHLNTEASADKYATYYTSSTYTKPEDYTQLTAINTDLKIWPGI